jgi:hypothetical protein
LHLDRIITDRYKNTEKVRPFFTTAIQSHFQFNDLLANGMKQDCGKTLREAIQKWNRTHLLKKDKNYEFQNAPPFEYNTYIRDFLKNNSEFSIHDTRTYWMRKMQTRGSKKYTKEDLKPK